MEKQYAGYTINAEDVIFQAQKGVVQGSVLAPMLFCKYIEVMMDQDLILAKKRKAMQTIIRTHQEDREVRRDQWNNHVALLYADDLVVEFKDYDEIKAWE